MRKGLIFEVISGLLTVLGAALICAMLLFGHVKPNHQLQSAGPPAATAAPQAFLATPDPATPPPSADPAATAASLPNTASRSTPSATPVHHRVTPTAAPTASGTIKPTPTPGSPLHLVVKVTPTSGAAPLLVTVDASGSSDATRIANFVFDFGDGTSSSPLGGGATATHTYNSPGVYTIVVTAIDIVGHSATASVTVTIT